MYRQLKGLALGIAALGLSASAQTTVTTSGGTTNTVPVFTGSATVVSSVITQSSGNVGIGTTAPTYKLQVNGAIFSSVSNAIGLVVTGNSSSFQGADISITRSTSGTGVGFSPALQFNDTATGYAGLIQSYQGQFQFWQYAGNGWIQNMTIIGSGNVGVGTTSPGAKLEVNGNVKLTSGSGASVTFADGTVQSTAYTGVTCGGDYAESVDVSGDRTNYEPGDVLVINPRTPGEFLKSAKAYSTSVTGIYSTKPGVVGRRQTTDPKMSTSEVPMAMVGIVPTKVSAENGPIVPGDLLVSSSTLGYAMKGTDHNQMLGAIIGKALGSLDSGTGIIEVVVTLQ